MLKMTLERDAHAGTMIALLISLALSANPKRRETLVKRAERLSTYRGRYWTPERLRAVARGGS